MSGHNDIGKDESKVSKAVQTLGTVLILLSWVQVALGNSIHSSEWYVIAYPWNLILECCGCFLWSCIGIRWKNPNVTIVNGALVVLAGIGIFTNLV